MIERAVVQFSFIAIQLDKCGENEPIVESMKTVRTLSSFEHFRNLHLDDRKSASSI